jgi:hypothetical protein
MRGCGARSRRWAQARLDLLEIRGPAEALASGGSALGSGFADAMIRIRPERIVSYGLDTVSTQAD